MLGDHGSMRFVHHYGKALALESLLIVYPDYDLSIAIVINRNLEGTSLLGELAQSITAALIASEGEGDAGKLIASQIH